MGEDFGGLSDKSAVDVVEGGSVFGEELAAFGEDVEGADAFDGGIGGWEVVADIGEAEGTEDGVGDGVGEDIRVGVSGEAVGVWDVDAAEDEGAVFSELVDVVADAGADHDFSEVRA